MPGDDFYPQPHLSIGDIVLDDNRQPSLVHATIEQTHFEREWTLLWDGQAQSMIDVFCEHPRIA